MAACGTAMQLEEMHTASCGCLRFMYLCRGLHISSSRPSCFCLAPTSNFREMVTAPAEEQAACLARDRRCGSRGATAGRMQLNATIPWLSTLISNRSARDLVPHASASFGTSRFRCSVSVAELSTPNTSAPTRAKRAEDTGRSE